MEHFKDAMLENDQPQSIGEAFAGRYRFLFGRQWPVWIGGLLFGMINVLMFAFEKPLSISDGVRQWGSWIYNQIGVVEKDIVPPYLYSTSVMIFGLFFGAFASALLSRQFQIRIAPPRELFKGLIGGIMMGVGSTLSFGCNIGGFFSATSALSLAGVAMMFGLILGSLIGMKIIEWEINHLSPISGKAPTNHSEGWKNAQPKLGAIALLIGIGAAFIYDGFDYPMRGGYLLFGIVIGIFMHRTRFCFIRAFRDPFMTGDGESVKAVALAVAISTLGFSVLKWTDLREWEAFVFPGFWFGSLIGGTIFGIGMSLSGGCASGSLWRAGEGHVKLWIALAAFALVGSSFRDWMVESRWIAKFGSPVFLPEVIGWKAGLISILVLMLLWVLFATWNEVHKKMVLI